MVIGVGVWVGEESLGFVFSVIVGKLCFFLWLIGRVIKLGDVEFFRKS